ncbi:sugar porter (SP) family MFS transporter [Clostridium acetobutylicum]|uniref:D-xylose-proton symporter n=1 Tax=Clostridium acetobutylicum (strain ATCC 824 / DSM 792 / JCM 1419 / IAM 19013 / LMG 5710 / NBRC 13948 / NRRL B-527 / VKM B-1787 / 2291 / W) TaxID=272562 RepID=Q97JE1_CLOAB|nr:MULTISPECIES: sugar porter family MFS transporter [Clostridium]AAK79313.1 D-xylose-proton symporter [Clostridium acetobutylicum ATCC 824]ADZ20396.1 D-xylose-proton symporter [Clostridium acetobutylicum EA 2018]AEI34005.1 D-xylose-proton symporter [Clostridium acetobutylicum DSM 1731]AWV81436.1 sugar porter family MFS transporter [Clostridium acetobutylicum]MBC2393073.1 sugar porter family MFS transporter [Clostridium acetobutylicum]
MNKKISPALIYFFGAFGGFMFGYDIGIINGALPGINATWHVSSWLEGFITSGLFVGAMIGASLMASLADRFGRRRMIMWSAIVFALGALGSAVSTSTNLLIGARVILGVAVGGASALVPMYMGEISPAETRGKLSGLNQLMITVGMLFSYGVNFAFAGAFEGWRWMLGGAMVPAMVLLIGTFILPESPRFLARIGKTELAKQVLQTLRSKEEAETEYQEIINSKHTETGSFGDLFAKQALPAVIAGCGLTLLQQIQGANTIFYYSSQILSNVFGSANGGTISTVGIGVVLVLATIVTLLVVDKFKRRTLFMTGSIGMGASLLLVGLIYPYSEAKHAWATWLVFFFICLYVVFYAYSWAATTWIVVGELFPSNVRGLATGIASAVNWFGNILVALFFPVLLETVGLSVIFFGFAAICIIGFLFAKYVLYETKGKSLEEIETYLYNRSIGKVRGLNE